MNAWLLRAAGAGLLILLGIVVGAWATTSHFRPLLDAEQGQLVTCKAARDNLAGLAAEQGKALGDLTLAANERQAGAEQAVSAAKVSADLDYAAANRLQQERTGGDQCAAAATIIDKELGL
ncbi:hypothetical protein H4B97_21870 [Pseudomonas juntendi]|uniref:Uncharacterized protein n=1 Tax=Pseudomonas juntendi TaxID=2666183 RepID=A0A7W2LQC6_9PSED|nr:hypothetical protein [Pseudomonas juntendi]MBA6145080.1 hypothetical protein [Pseudomonas juntendi]